MRPSLASIKILLIGFLITDMASAARKLPHEYWNEKVLPMNFALSHFSPEACNDHINSFTACYIAIDELASFIKKDVAVINGELVIKDIKATSSPQAKSLQDMIALNRREISIQQSEANELYMSNNRQTDLMLYAKLLLSDKSVGEKKWFYASLAINKKLELEIDPHTRILSLAEMKEELQSDTESFSGIGAKVSAFNKSIVCFPIVKQAAHKAGMKDGDIIKTVDGVEVAADDLADAVNRLRGKTGTTVKLVVERDGKQIALNIKRQKFEIKNVEYENVVSNGKKYAFIKIYSFAVESVANDVKDAFTQANKDKVSGVILDLRNNPGGLLNQSAAIASLLLKNGSVIVSKKDLDSDKVDTFVSGAYDKFDFPMVTIINASSASASELVSGSLQDNRRSWILGETSFGKGTVQHVLPHNQIDGLAMARTLEQFYLPSGRTNQLNGVVPDFIVPFKPGATEEERFSMREKDLYINAIGKATNDWVQPRPGEVENLSKCMSSNGKAKNLYEQGVGVNDRDYQLNSAIDLLNCESIK